VLIKVAEPELAVDEIGNGCCASHDLLAPGGLALIQIKYDEGRFWTRPRRRAYRSGIADMTTYPIAEFWQLAARCGLRPESIELVSKNELDERYAYFLLSKSSS
jgi:hypothetical protein